MIASPKHIAFSVDSKIYWFLAMIPAPIRGAVS
jgi:hypothetical protein